MQGHQHRQSDALDAKNQKAGRVVLFVAAAWVLSLGFDVLLHAGLLSRLYLQPSAFLLGPEEAFRRIPLGYLAFVILTLALYWLVLRLDIRGAWAGFRFGAIVGLVVWGGLAIGLYSISTAAPSLLVGWWLGQAIELGLTGAVLGAAVGGASLRRIWGSVSIAVVACLVVTIILQSIGWAPPMKVVQ